MKKGNNGNDVTSSEQADADAMQRLLDDMGRDSLTDVTSLTDHKSVEKDFSNSGSDDNDGSFTLCSKAADLYKHTTVLFCDICGEW